MSIKLRRLEGSVASSLTCPYCRDYVQPSHDLSTCADCHTDYHQECLSELGRCGTLGCSGLEVPNRGCLRCAQPITDQDLVLRCSGCERLYHRDCFIPGAVCSTPKCEGTVEFLKVAARPTLPPREEDDGRCIAEGCRRPQVGVGWATLGTNVRSMCREHASGSRQLHGLVFLLVPFLLSFVLITTAPALMFLGLLLALPFAVDSWRIDHS